MQRRDILKSMAALFMATAGPVWSKAQKPVRTFVLIDYDLETWEIRRIIHPESDAGLSQYPMDPGWARVIAVDEKFPADLVNCRLHYTLPECAKEVERQTGRKPPNAYGMIIDADGKIGYAPDPDAEVVS